MQLMHTHTQVICRKMRGAEALKLRRGSGVSSPENFEFQVPLDAISWHVRPLFSIFLLLKRDHLVDFFLGGGRRGRTHPTHTRPRSHRPPKAAPKNARGGGPKLRRGSGVSSPENFEFQVPLEAISWHVRPLFSKFLL